MVVLEGERRGHSLRMRAWNRASPETASPVASSGFEYWSSRYGIWNFQLEADGGVGQNGGHMEPSDSSELRVIRAEQERLKLLLSALDRKIEELERGQIRTPEPPARVSSGPPPLPRPEPKRSGVPLQPKEEKKPAAVNPGSESVRI